METFMTTLDAFLDSGAEFEKAVMDSTTAGFGGGGYSLELFEDGTWRVLWDNQIGNLYCSPGVILSIPQYWDDECDLSFALDEIARQMRANMIRKAAIAQWEAL